MRFLSLLVLSTAIVAGCDRAPSDLREWKPEDHDRSDEAEGRSAAARAPGPAAGSARAGGHAPAGSAKPPSAASGATVPASATGSVDTLATLVDVTWKTQCAACHGMSGRGDGPQGPMVHAPDLTRADWQAKVSDEEIARMITTGKDRMPKFDFPPEVVQGLTKRIRASRGR
jgi:cytochrome c oxidase cbb3-type subunit 3